MSVNRTAAAITTYKVRNHRTFTTPSISPVEKPSLDLLGRQRWEAQYKRCFFMTRQMLYPNYLEESRNGRQFGVLPADTWDARLNHMSPLVKNSRSKLAGSLHYTSRQEDQCTGMKKKLPSLLQ